MDIYSGDDQIGAAAILAGAKGIISVTANVAPRAMHELCAAALDGNRGEAERINGRLKPLHEALFLESNPIPVKWAVSELGLIPSGIRLPLTPLSASLHATVRQAMQEAGIL
jgi:4-hydroxy-tetrahydrodipicolinate synthase